MTYKSLFVLYVFDLFTVVENRSAPPCSAFTLTIHNLSTIAIHFILFNNTVRFTWDRWGVYSNIGFNSYTI